MITHISHKFRLLMITVTTALFVSNANAYKLTVKNNTDGAITVKASFHGRLGLLCKNEKFDVTQGDKETINTTLCCLKNVKIKPWSGSAKRKIYKKTVNLKNGTVRNGNQKNVVIQLQLI
mgnify:CR=1 FL=1